MKMAVLNKIQNLNIKALGGFKEILEPTEIVWTHTHTLLFDHYSLKVSSYQLGNCLLLTVNFFF